MLSRLIFYIVSFVLSILHSFAQQDSVHTLKQCVELAVKSNPQLRQSELDVESGKIDLRQAKQNLLPSLNGSAAHGISTGRNVDPTTNLFVEETVNSGNLALGSSVTLFDGLKMFKEIRRRSSALEAGKLEFAGAINDLKLDVITAYIQVLTAQDMVAQIYKQFEVTKERLRTSEVKQKEGAMDPQDYYDIRGEYNANRISIEENRKLLNDARATLANLLNIEVSRIGILEFLDHRMSSSVSDEVTLFNKATQVLPQFEAWQQRLEEAEFGVKSAKAEYYPSLILNAGLNTNYSNLSNLTYAAQIRNYLGRFVSLGIQIPIFNQFQVKNQVKRAVLEVDNVRWQQEIALNNLREQTSKAVFDIQTAARMVENLEEQERNYAESFRIAQLKFDLGESDSVLYLTAKSKLENAQNALIMSRYEWVLQKYINDFYAGELDL